MLYNTIYIDQVEKQKDIHGCEVITKVCYTTHKNLKATNWCTKKQMIMMILTNPITVKTKYIKHGVWQEGAIVRVVDYQYLRTDSNYIKADNLGELD